MRGAPPIFSGFPFLVRRQYQRVAIPFFAQHFDKETHVFTPGNVQDKAAAVMLDELLKWATAMKPMRPA